MILYDDQSTNMQKNGLNEIKNDVIRTGKIFNNGGRMVGYFKRNKFGYFDLED